MRREGEGEGAVPPPNQRLDKGELKWIVCKCLRFTFFLRMGRNLRRRGYTSAPQPVAKTHGQAGSPRDSAVRRGRLDHAGGKNKIPKKKVRAVRLNVASVRKKRHNDGTVGTRSAQSAKLFISFLFSLSVLLPASGFFPPSFNLTVIHLFHNFLPFLNRLFVA